MLTHHSGLPADKRYDLDGSSWEDVFRTALIAEPGSEHKYSDVGFLILGRIVEKVSGKFINDYLDEFVYGPLGLETTVFNPENPLRRIAPTEIDPDGNLIHGIVHDEKARYFGGMRASVYNAMPIEGVQKLITFMKDFETTNFKNV